MSEPTPAVPESRVRAATLTSSEAILAVADVRETVRFYRDVLGFESEWFWGEPPTFGGLRWGKAQLMLCQQPELAARVEGHQHWFGCEDINALHDRHKASGAPIITPIEDRPWGSREYTVRDPDGYHLRFGGPVAFKRPASALDTLPAGVGIVERLPTFEEYAMLTRAVGWARYINYDAAPVSLENSLFAVVAMDGETAVGMGRVVGDGAAFFYLQDVLVLPSRQYQRIGTAIVDALMAYLERSAPKHAFIGLFTGRNVAGFYERYGFQGPETALQGMSLRKQDRRLGRPERGR